MAEAIPYGIVQKIITDLGSIVYQDIESAANVKKELRKLENTMITIKDVLLDAEEQQLGNHEVRTWLKRIKDVAYEADDVIDDFTIEALRKKQRNIIKMVRNFFSPSNPIIFHFKMARKIKEIRENLSEIQADRSFHLETRVEVPRPAPNSWRENTHSYIDESEEVFGREDVKEEIIESLLRFDGEEKLSIVSIQGIGGLGKTTLAKLVRNDKRIVSNFDLIMWVCVSQDFDVKNITEKIIQSATDAPCPNLEMDQLQYRLREQLGGKRFLLVLDDVWNEDYSKWDALKGLLLGGANGSKLIVTTRNKYITRMIRSDSPYELSGLTDEHCWSLFRSKAFKKGQEEENPNLVKIGTEIVKKCGGVPLAVKSVGSLMYSKIRESEWVQVLNSGVWVQNDTISALRLSYNNLSFFLRQCFAYCSIAPKNVVIDKMSLIHAWIAHGFIHSSEETQSLEDVGNDYIESLLWIAFLQEAKVDLYKNVISVRMHDLVHDLAQSIAGDECFAVHEDTTHIPEGVRYLDSSHKDFSLESLEALPKPCKLRQLYAQCEFKSLVENIFSSCTFLRVLGLDVKDQFENLPSSIGDLKHLRYLDLWSYSITTVTLPKSIIKLQRLQTLEFSRCCRIKELPRDIHLMSELRHIIIREEDSALYSHMPIGLGQLTSLQTLSVFIVGKGMIGCKLNALQRLRHLRGKLTIKNLENVGNAGDSENANLKEKTKLEELKLVWNEVGVRRNEIDVDVLENLQPNQSLKGLFIEGYGGDRFSRWLMDSALPNLVKICLKKCRKCEHLPPFGNLQFLEFLELEEMNDLRFMQTGGRRDCFFPSLKELKISNVLELESWLATKEEDSCTSTSTSTSTSFPCLLTLTISGCPKLTAMPLLPSLEKCVLVFCSEELVRSLMLQQKQQLISSSAAGTLKHLRIEACYNLICLSDKVFQGLSGLLELEIRKCVRLTCLSGLQHLTSLENLDLFDCEELHTLEGFDGLTCLENLFIRKIPKLESIPEGLQNATKLRHLEITKCEGLMGLPECLGNLTSLETLGIDAKYLMNYPNELRILKSLKLLGIVGSSSIVSLPEELQHLTGLEHLCIIMFEELTSLPEWLGKLTSLRELQIRNCPNLGFMPRWIETLTSLQLLYIDNCDKLKPRCKKNIGEDWPYIAHVPNIKLDEEWIQ